ncbi:hypothetical protein CMO95_00015 [Candidatus Woesearchaeota archaeon]|nr:hypothetical protein [Candidatus Woesearchaeota archaeon]|tara:strand:- start:2235 stop:2552 length:318 start_codon:yes stop_codon:yes gene_type:complete
MTKKINRYSIEKYFKKLEIETERKTPIDIKEFINSKRFSESLGDVIKVGDMDLIHLIRTLKKENDYWVNAYLDMKKHHREFIDKLNNTRSEIIKKESIDWRVNNG